MTFTSISEARWVWLALLRSGVPCEPAQWTAWSEARLFATERAPEWLCDFGSAATRDEALHAVSAGIGQETPPEIDEQGLVIGFVVGRHLSGELTFEAMWEKLTALTDIAEFLDAEKWKQYSTLPSSQVVGPPNAEHGILVTLGPLADFANEVGSSLLAGPNPSFKRTPDGAA